MGGEFPGDETVAAPEIEEGGGGAKVVAQDGLEELGWVGGAEGGVGEGVESCLAKGGEGV